MFGALWSDHIVRGWRAKLRRPTGGTLFGFLVWLTATGCALYYVGSDRWRAITSLLHWVPGLAALVVFVLHFKKKGPGVATRPLTSASSPIDQKL